ncbi:ATP-binding protein [Streptomyces sp. NPDC051567]|uniref:ATP-binding protein n=1 Tax=Streptomyces sp. NPDC051567 TaxID=3365660 RepID=UPI0037AE43D7
MDHLIEWRYSRTPVSVPRARAHFAVQSREWKLPADTAETAVLLLSELMTNACRHARVSGREVWVRCERGDGVVRVEVADADGKLPVPAVARELDESGRGLAIVAELASRWGAYPRECGIGKVVWFEVEWPAEESGRG